jgi:ectoine hydroxylase-related dioxygenase (phytanoyl-CoA dioxygenase family)
VEIDFNLCHDGDMRAADPPAGDLVVEVTEADVERFRRDGFVAFERITTDAEVGWLREVFDELFDAKVGGFAGGYFDLSRPYDSAGADHVPQVLMPELRVPALRATIFHRNATKVAARLLDVPADSLQRWGHMIDKPPHHGGVLPWHQDEAYWEPTATYHAVGAWLPLDDVDERNGCMTFLPGSHRGEVRPHRHIGDDPTVHGLQAESVDADDPAVRAAAVAVPLAAGGATFHHPRTLHSTGPNLTDRRRRAFATEVQTAPARNPAPPARPWVDAGRAAFDARIPRR